MFFQLVLFFLHIVYLFAVIYNLVIGLQLILIYHTFFIIIFRATRLIVSALQSHYDTSSYIGTGVSIFLVALCCRCCVKCFGGKSSTEKERTETAEAEPAVHYPEVNTFFECVQLEVLLLKSCEPIVFLFNSNCRMTMSRGQTHSDSLLGHTTPLGLPGVQLAWW